MSVIVVTRLRLKDPALFDEFFASAVAVVEQAQSAEGNLGADVLAEANNTYWTRTVWQERDLMNAFVGSQPHLHTMSRIDDWCDEATFVEWEQAGADLSTAVIVMYDDSDGGYDHVMPPIVNDSQISADALTGTGQCGTQTPILGGYQGRCGYGPRLPFVVISPWATVNAVDHTLTDQTSVIHFIEDNWMRAQRIGDGSYDELSGPITGMFNFSGNARAPKLFLNQDTGEPTTSGGNQQ